MERQSSLFTKIMALKHIYLKLGLIPIELNEESPLDEDPMEVCKNEETVHKMEEQVIETIKSGLYGETIYELKDINEKFKKIK